MIRSQEVEVIGAAPAQTESSDEEAPATEQRRDERARPKRPAEAPPAKLQRHAGLIMPSSPPLAPQPPQQQQQQQHQQDHPELGGETFGRTHLRMQTAPPSCRVLELVAQHGWVPEEQIKPLNNSLSRIEILTRYVSAVDDNADSATAHCWHDGFWIDSDGHWHPTDSPAFGDAGYWSD